MCYTLRWLTAGKFWSVATSNKMVLGTVCPTGQSLKIPPFTMESALYILKRPQSSSSGTYGATSVALPPARAHVCASTWHSPGKDGSKREDGSFQVRTPIKIWELQGNECRGKLNLCIRGPPWLLFWLFFVTTLLWRISCDHSGRGSRWPRLLDSTAHFSQQWFSVRFQTSGIWVWECVKYGVLRIAPDTLFSQTLWVSKTHAPV